MKTDPASSTSTPSSIASRTTSAGQRPAAARATRCWTWTSRSATGMLGGSCGVLCASFPFVCLIGTRAGSLERQLQASLVCVLFDNGGPGSLAGNNRHWLDHSKHILSIVAVRSKRVSKQSWRVLSFVWLLECAHLQFGRCCSGTGLAFCETYLTYSSSVLSSLQGHT